MDRVTSQQRSENMRKIRSEGMKPEMAVRRMIHHMGYRFRLHRKDLAGKPDLVFGPRKKIIFVHGCFWHQHSDPNCRDGRLPKSNRSYWVPKLEKNTKRDGKNEALLQSLGWKLMVIWECEVEQEEILEKRIKAFLN